MWPAVPSSAHHREQSLQEPAQPCRQPVNADSFEGQSQGYHCQWVLHSSCLKQALTVGSKSPLPSLAEQGRAGTSFADMPHALFLQLSLWSRIIRNITVRITQTQLKHLLSNPRGLRDLGWSPLFIKSARKGQTHPEAATTPLQLSVIFWHISHNQS